MAGRHLSKQTLRGISTSSSLGQLVKPPVAVFGTEGRYATALFSAASKQKSLDAVEKDLNGFKAQIKKDVKLQEFLLDPSVKKSIKMNGLGDACDKMKMNALSKNMLVAMAENGRYKNMDAAVDAFGTIMSAYRGEIVCQVTTAKNIDANSKKEIEAAIAGFVKSGQKSQISYSVDPSIIGGMIVSIGDKYVDMSMATKLKKYEDIIKSAA